MAENIKRFEKEQTRTIMIGRIASLRNAGFTPGEIAITVEMPESKVRAIINKYGPAMDKVYGKA